MPQIDFEHSKSLNIKWSSTQENSPTNCEQAIVMKPIVIGPVILKSLDASSLASSELWIQRVLRLFRQCVCATPTIRIGLSNFIKFKLYSVA